MSEFFMLPPRKHQISMLQPKNRLRSFGKTHQIFQKDRANRDPLTGSPPQNLAFRPAYLACINHFDLNPPVALSLDTSPMHFPPKAPT
jgi:hypothetical protein